MLPKKYTSYSVSCYHGIAEYVGQAIIPEKNQHCMYERTVNQMCISHRKSHLDPLLLTRESYSAQASQYVWFLSNISILFFFWETQISLSIHHYSYN